MLVFTGKLSKQHATAWSQFEIFLYRPHSALILSSSDNSTFCVCVCHSYPTALALIASGAVNVQPLMTHHFKLEQSLEAFETSRTGAGGAIKVVIHCNEGYRDYQM